MQYMPEMSNAEWKEYERWVAGFGAMEMDTAARNTRKLRRRLREARRPKVTLRIAHSGTVLNEVRALTQLQLEQMSKFVHLYGMSPKVFMEDRVREDGVAHGVSATRQK